MSTHKDPARASLRKLVEHVFAHRNGLITSLFYNELAERIGRLNKHGRGHGHGMGKVLGNMGHLLEGLDGKWGEPIPHIQSLVVNMTGKLKGLPDEGIREFWPDYPKMTRVEKENRTRVEHQRIVAFGSRWNDVLTKLDIPGVALRDNAENHKGRFGSGGESSRHKELKKYIYQHPDIVGATSKWKSFMEYGLPTCDEIDVLFKTTNACIAVEVKSAVSDSLPSDYERGIFQTVKYGALLEAMSRSGRYEIPSQVKTILLLESQLPAEFRSLAKVLGVKILENIKMAEPA